jgi:surface antigen
MKDKTRNQNQPGEHITRRWMIMRGATKRVLMLAVLIPFMVAACATTQEGQDTKTIVGGFGGAAAGGLLALGLGGNTATVIGSTLLGGLIGGAIGNRMDAADKRQAQAATTKALETAPSGASTQWKNPDSGNYGTVTPVRTYQTESGQYCREYRQTVMIGGEQNEAYGKACRQADGSWKIVQ